MMPELFLIDKRIKESTDKDWQVLVIKGFSHQIYSHLSHEFVPLEPSAVFNDQNELVLSSLRVILPPIMGKLFQIDKNNRMVMLFETFRLISKNIKLDIFPFNFLILTNNFFEQYPNPTDTILPDYEKLIESKDILPDGDVVSDLFSAIITVDGRQYIQYIDGLEDEYNNLFYLPFIEIGEMPSVSILPPNQIPGKAISFKVNDEKLILLKEKWLKKAPDSDISFLVDQSLLVSDESKVQIKILSAFFQYINISVAFIKLDNRLTKDVRKELYDILWTHWKSDSFRALQFYKDPDIGKEIISIGQGEIIECIVTECERACNTLNDFRDIFLTAPTGAGKSLLFQLPAMYIANKYQAITIVVSPLIALMKDQVVGLKDKGYHNVVCLNSELSLIERENEISKIKGGDTHIVYLSPELLLSYDISMFIGERKIGLLVIDEAHLVTTWGRDFRVDYWYLGYFIKKIRRFSTHRFPVLAVTATAVYDPHGSNDMVFETLDSLAMDNAIKYIGKVRRDDIMFSVNRPSIKGGHEEFKIRLSGQRINEFCKNHVKTIVYCPWITQIAPIRGQVDAEFKELVQVYYGRLDATTKEEGYTSFRDGKALVMIATKAFGMGVDIDDITAVYHHAPSGHLADYIQEIGRLARRADLIGNAIIDYTNKDLKYTRILFGLSSIKQYQVSMVLDKLNKIYKYKKTRNLLVTVNDFEYIFNFDKVDVDQKVKSSLLLLEKDLLARYRYNVLIVRPKSLFTTGYIHIHQDEVASFQSKYRTYIKPVSNYRKESKGLKVFILALDKLWEDNFNDKSFPMVKRSFFEGTLFGTDFPHYKPQLRISYIVDDEAESSFNKLTVIFEHIEKSLSKFTGFFTKSSLLSELKNNLKDSALAKRIADLILSLYSDPGSNDFSIHKHIPDDCFLQSRRDDHEYTYRVIKKSYNKVMASMRSTFFELFKKGQNNIQQTVFISADSVKDYGKKYIRMAYVIETFNLGSYEIAGGEAPAIFIRINDPVKIDWLSRIDYENNILAGIKSRFETSAKIMEYFFTNDLSDTDRWDFIEDFFLGAQAEELIQRNHIK